MSNSVEGDGVGVGLSLDLTDHFVAKYRKLEKELSELLKRQPNWPGGLPDPGETGVKVLGADERRVWAELLAERCLQPIEGGAR